MDSDIVRIISNDAKLAAVGLKNFLDKNAKTFYFPHLSEYDQYQQLWKALTVYICNPNAEDIHLHVLNTIRILSRDKTGLNDVITSELLDVLLENAGIKTGEFFDDPQQYQISVECLKCLCNIIYNSTVAATMCCNNGTLEGIIKRLKISRDSNGLTEMYYFDMKILFIISALCSHIRPKLREDLHGLSYLIEALDQLLYANNIGAASINQRPMLTDLQVNTACEILKVLFNLSVRSWSGSLDEEEEAHCLNLVTILRKFLIAKAVSLEKKHELVNHIVNLLTNMPNAAYKQLSVTVSEGQNIDKDLVFEDLDMEAIHEILEFLKRCLNEEPTVSHQHELLSPALTALLRGVTIERPIRKYLRIQILPPLKDVHHRPEQGNTLRNCICRLLTTPITQVRDLAAELLFVLCKENVNRMIKYTGYGNAAGLFARRGLLGGKSTDTSGYSSDSDTDTEEYRESKHGINPVLGCYEPPRPNPTANMTEEQKEHEAMKLVELMNNLTRTGVVKPCKIGPDGRPIAVEHVLELQAGLRSQLIHHNDSDSE